jgi:hypothetical protein
VQFPSFVAGTLANVPFVIVQPDGAIAETLGSDGVKRTTERFAETGLARAESLFQGAEAAVADRLTGGEILNVTMIGEYTVLAINDACHQVALLIGVGHTLFVDDSLCRCRQIIPHRVQHFFYFQDFIHAYGCTRFAFDATLAFALGKVAAELFRNDVGRKQHVADLKDGGKGLVHE